MAMSITDLDYDAAKGKKKPPPAALVTQPQQPRPPVVTPPTASPATNLGVGDFLAQRDGARLAELGGKVADAGRAVAGGIADVAKKAPQAYVDHMPGAGYAVDLGKRTGEAYDRGGAGAAAGTLVRGLPGQALAYLAEGAQAIDKNLIEPAARALDPAAQFARTLVTGDTTPIREVMARQDSPGIIPTAAAATNPAPSKPAAAPVAQAAPAAVQPQAAPTRSGPAALPSIADLQPGTGVIRNNRTGAATSIASTAQQGAEAAPVVSRGTAAPAAITAPAAVESPERAAARQQLALHNDLMGRKDGGIGEAVVAGGALRKGKALNDQADAQDRIALEGQRVGIADFEARSRDADRQDEATDRAAKRKDAAEDRALRKELASLDDKSDPGGVKRESIRRRLSVLSGGDHFQPIVGKDEMGNSVVIGIFDKSKGTLVDSAGQPVKAPQQIAWEHHNARAMVDSGRMTLEEANRRLLANGYPAIQ